jgi:hypothetical protein
VIGHRSYEEVDEDGINQLVYLNISFIFDPVSHTASEMKIIGDKKCYPATEAMRDDLKDCAFTGGSAGKMGGSIFHKLGVMNLENCTFDGGVAGSVGGNVCNYGKATINFIEIEVSRDDDVAELKYIIDKDGTVGKTADVIYGADIAIDYIPKNTDTHYFAGWYLDENFVNEVINKKIDVVCTEQPYAKAVADGAYGVFNAESDDQIVTIYTIGDVDKQICGGPHAKNTGDLGKFKIQKEESSSSGVRRIKAVLVND